MGIILIKPSDLLRSVNISLTAIKIKKTVLPKEYRDFADIFIENKNEYLL